MNGFIGYIFGRSKIRKVCRCKHAVSNETILTTRQELFFTKVTSVQGITDIVLLVFSLMLLSWIFISSCTTFYFFVKKFIFSNVYNFVNTIFDSLYVFWLRKEQSIKYFCLIVSCFICRNLTLPLFKKDVFVRNGFFTLMRSISVAMK